MSAETLDQIQSHYGNYEGENATSIEDKSTEARHT